MYLVDTVEVVLDVCLVLDGKESQDEGKERDKEVDDEIEEQPEREAVDPVIRGQHVLHSVVEEGEGDRDGSWKGPCLKREEKGGILTNNGGQEQPQLDLRRHSESSINPWEVDGHVGEIDPGGGQNSQGQLEIDGSEGRGSVILGCYTHTIIW